MAGNFHRNRAPSTTANLNFLHALSRQIALRDRVHELPSLSASIETSSLVYVRACACVRVRALTISKEVEETRCLSGSYFLSRGMQFDVLPVYKALRCTKKSQRSSALHAPSA